MQTGVVEVENLSRRFGKTQALDGISLTVQPGLVYGLVGANGQGKTTLLRHILGLYRAQRGSVRVFGHDPVAQPVQVLERIGYLSEDRELPEWMRIDELMRYTSAYYPDWDHAYAHELLSTFGLDVSKRIKNLSKGMRAQVGLVAAVAHRPQLLILDEPSTGLDAVVRKDILNAIIRTVANDGRTVIFSSHLLDEVEMMSDQVLMMNQGQLVLSGDLDEIKSDHCVLMLRIPANLKLQATVPGILSLESRGDEFLAVADSVKTRQQIEATGCRVMDSRGASLQEIFIARVGRDRSLADSPDMSP